MQVAFSTQSEMVEHSSSKQPFPLVLPSPMNPNGQRQTKPSGELTQVAFSTQSEIDEHSSATILNFTRAPTTIIHASRIKPHWTMLTNLRLFMVNSNDNKF